MTAQASRARAQAARAPRTGRQVNDPKATVVRAGSDLLNQFIFSSWLGTGLIRRMPANHRNAARRCLSACIDAAWFEFDVARLRSIARARWVGAYRRTERQERQAPTP